MAIILAVAGSGISLVPVYADTYSDCIKEATTQADKAKCGMDATQNDPDAAKKKTLEGTVKNIINAVLYVVGILAVVMVIIGGIQYTTSGGDQAAVTKAKNTILYGIVGLIIAILAYAIVNFVIGKVDKSQDVTTSGLIQSIVPEADNSVAYNTLS